VDRSQSFNVFPLEDLSNYIPLLLNKEHIMRFKNQDTLVSLRLPSEVDKKIQWIADQKYTDKSSIHRDALRVYLIDNKDFFTDDFMTSNSHHSSKFA